MWNVYVITDTHFSHNEMYEKFWRPKDFENKIWKWLRQLKEEDTLIHLWDFCIGNDIANAYKWKEIVKCKTTILVKWNHDGKSDKWYQDNAGFSCVVDWMLKKINGVKIYFSHIPSELHLWDMNIHWHTHWNSVTEEKERRTESAYDRYYSKNFVYDVNYHKDFSLEKYWYRPHTIKAILK